MTILSPAFKRFENRLSEVAHLRIIAGKYARLRSILGSPDQAAHTNALVRAGTVLLSSHIQGYVEDVSELVVDNLVKARVESSRIPDVLRFHATKSAIRQIKDANDPDTTVKRIREYGITYGEILSDNGIMTEKFLGSGYKDGFGNPTVSEVKKYFGRFGLVDFQGRMAQKLKHEWPIVENAINQIVDRRNKIAHGDVQATLTVGELSDYISLSRKFASAADRVVTSHFRSLGCRFWPTDR